MMNSKDVREVFRFAIVGGSGLVANLTLMALFVEIVNIPSEYAAILSTVLVLLGGFAFTDNWVFDRSPTGDGVNSLVKRGSAYYAVMLTGKGVNYGLYIALLSFGIWYPVAWGIGSVVVFVGTFSTNKLLWDDYF